MHVWFLLSVVVICQTAPPVCRSCTKNCFQNKNSTIISNSNSTDTEDLIAELAENRVRPKRDVEQKPCTRFQVEMVLIPVSISMIPLALCALILCTCCCGPKDSRVKLPEEFLANLPMSKKKRMSSEEMELEFRDGYVQRKDSAKTKFSTVVSYIEARRESLWSQRSLEPSSPNPLSPHKTFDNLQFPGRPVRDCGPEIVPGGQVEHQGAYLQTLASPTDASETESTTNLPAKIQKNDRLQKVPSQDSMKRTRFSDTVSVISVDSLGRR